jgi:hypothetical protein
MDLLDRARQGFQSVQVDEEVKRQALRFLGQWLSDKEFAPYRPQLAWLIEREQWPGLLDRFYQILPFGTVAAAGRWASAPTA